MSLRVLSKAKGILIVVLGLGDRFAEQVILDVQKQQKFST